MPVKEKINAQKKYLRIEVDVPRVVESWKASLYSFEWLNPDGNFKNIEEMVEKEKAKRIEIEQKISAREELSTAVLGIGMFDNIEIGAGRAEFLTQAAQGIETLPVDILASHESDFKPFLAEVE